MRYFIVSYKGDYGWQQVIESQKHAAQRWGAEYIEYHDDPRCRLVYDDIFYMLDEFEPEDEIAHVDADILYRIDCPNPFEHTPENGIAYVDDRDICRSWEADMEWQGRMISRSWYEIFGTHFEKECKRYGVENVVPGNSGFVLGKQKELKAVSVPFYEMLTDIEERVRTQGEPWFVQKAICIAAHKLGKANILPSMFNHLNTEEYIRRPSGYPTRGEGMIHESLHLAGTDNHVRDKYFEFLDWTQPGL